MQDLLKDLKNKDLKGKLSNNVILNFENRL